MYIKKEDWTEELKQAVIADNKVDKPYYKYSIEYHTLNGMVQSRIGDISILDEYAPGDIIKFLPGGELHGCHGLDGNKKYNQARLMIEVL